MLVIKNVFYRNCFEIGEQIYGSMRLLGLAVLLCFMGCEPAPVYGQSVIRNLPWELNTSRPAQQEWQLVRGETVDLECRYLSGASAMDVRGASVVLHCLTNGMAAGISYQVTGHVGRVTSTNLASVGWVTVRVRPGSDLPPNVKSVAFTLETTLNSARNLVASGTLRLSGDPTGAFPASVPVYGYDVAGSAQTVSNALLGAVQAVSSNTSAQISGISSNTATVLASVSESIAQVSDRVSAIPPPSSDALRLMTPNGLEWRDATGAVWRVTWIAFTNVSCTLSETFGVLAERDWYDRPEQNVYVGELHTQIECGNDWYINFDQNQEGLWNVFNYHYPAYWSASGAEPPLIAHAGGYAWFGTASFDYVVTFIAVTQIVDTVALRSDLIGFSGGGSSTNCVFSTANGTNYVPVWSESFGTYLIQGFAQ